MALHKKSESEAGTRGCFRCRTPSYVDEEVYMRCDKPEGQPCLPCKKMKLLEDEMKKTEARMKELLEEHHQMRTVINRAHDPVIGRVPQEITSLIFQHVITGLWDLYEEQDPFLHKTKVVAPLQLAAVCKTWRFIAFNTPCLWNHIHLYILSGKLHVDRHAREFSRDSWEAKLDVFRQWSIRARQLPLSVHLEAWVANADGAILQRTFEDYVEDEEREYIRPFIDILCEISPRLQTLTIMCSGNSFDYFMAKSRLPQIRRLTILPLLHPEVPYDKFEFHRNNIWNDDEQLLWFSFRQMLPRLEMTSKINWSQLTYLNSSYFDLYECFDVLQNCPKMTHCYFNNIKRTEFKSDSFPPLIHTSLEVFSLLLGYHHNDIIDKLTLPNLHSLSTRLKGSSLLNDCLFPFIERSSCALKSLSLCDLQVEEVSTLIKLFQSQSSIEHLALDTASSPNGLHLSDMSFYGSLTETASLQHNDEKRRLEARLLPNLRSFLETPKPTSIQPWSIHSMMAY